MNVRSRETDKDVLRTGLRFAVVTGQELVRLAMEKLEVTGYTALARKLELGLHGDRRVKRWAEGENEPNYEETLTLLRAVGLLREEPSEPLPAFLFEPVGMDVVFSRLETLEATVGGLAVQVGTAATRVGERLLAIEGRLPALPEATPEQDPQTSSGG